MAEQEFSEFIRRKTAPNQSESGEAIDWAKRRADWLQQLDDLYAGMEDHLRPYTHAGDIQIERTPIQLREEDLGTYKADKLTFKIGREKIVAKPIGTSVIGARGRVDLSGPRRTLKILLLAKGGPVLTTEIEHGGVAEESNRSMARAMSMKQAGTSRLRPRRALFSRSAGTLFGTRSWKFPVASRVSLSGAHLAANQVAEHHAVVEEAIHLYYTEASPGFEKRFAYLTEAEVLAERDQRIHEADAADALVVLASIEAAVRVDYFKRCYARDKDQLSRTLRALYQDKGSGVSLSDDLLQAWKNDGAMTGRLVSEVRGALRLRHWLAHGRYYEAKLGRQCDFASVYNLAREVEAALSSHRSVG